MTAHPAAWNSLVFIVPRMAATRIRLWQQEVNLRLIAAQLAAEGEVRVIRLGNTLRPQRITHLPAPGEAEPNVGDFGGLYTFTFSPRSDACELRVVAAPAAFTRVGIEPVAPLVFDLPGGVEPTYRVGTRYGHEWSEPLLTADGDSFIHEVSRDVLEFFIDGTMYERLVAWGWDALQVEAYDYIFVPLSVGCFLAVRHGPSGREIDLTADVGECQ